MAKGMRGLWRESLQAVADKTELDVQEVERVAYRLYEQRDRQDGRDLDDWLKAEEIVRRRNEQGRS